MPEISKKEVEDLLRKYKSKLRREIVYPTIPPPSQISSKEYQEFKKAYMPAHLSLYEKLCGISERILKISPDKKKGAEMQKQINSCHLNITPSGATSFAIMAPFVLAFFGAALSIFLLKSIFFAFFFAMTAVGLYFPFTKLPEFIANTWRLKASNQMVLCVFYVVTYMRHTSNLELAIQFASEHVAPPMSLDLKKIMWDVETEKFDSVRESLDYYLEGWREFNMEFVESFHLIESSLFEANEARRVNVLERGLEVMLDGTYEKMLHYAHNLKSPITSLHMMGIILPILGLVILPLAVSFMKGIKWYHIGMLYNVIIPIAVYYMGKGILAKRPTGYGDTDIAEMNPELKKFRNIVLKIGKSEVIINPVWFALFIGITLGLLALSPLIMHTINPDFDINYGGYRLLDFRESREQEGVVVGPYGIGSTILSLAVPLSLGLALGFFYKASSKNVLKIRADAQRLESEFASALFQLGNRMADGLPAEIAFGKVAEIMESTPSGNFFQIVSTNIRKLGMGVREAIYNPQVGALNYYPSNIISSSMKVLIESSRKGPMVASQALINVSIYIKSIHSVNERLKDLMADIIASMKSQISFLTPVIAGIVVGITSMITAIMGQLQNLLQTQITGEAGGAGVMSLDLSEMFGDGVPTYYFQIIVGVYVIQIIYILTVLANGIENGSDSLGERYALGQNLIRSTLLYCFISLAIIIMFNILAMKILSATVV